MTRLLIRLERHARSIRIYYLRGAPGLYNLYSNDCAIVAEQLLEQAGVPGVPDTMDPTSLINAT